MSQRSLGAKPDAEGRNAPWRHGRNSQSWSCATLTHVIFTPADDKLFSDFSFRGQLEPAGFIGAIDVILTDSAVTSRTLVFTGVEGPNSDFARLGIVSNDGETLKSL
jgi:hypothetical protein